MEVTDNAAADRFELKVGDHVAMAFYRIADGVITFTHTEVPQALSGQGVGTRLARGALELVKARGLKVVPQCPFMAAFTQKHPDFSELLA